MAIAFPGPFDVAGGRALIRGLHKFESIYGLDLRTELRRRLAATGSPIAGLPIEFARDSESAGMGEAVHGAGRDGGRVLTVTIGTGLGACLTAARRRVDAVEGVEVSECVQVVEVVGDLEIEKLAQRPTIDGRSRRRAVGTGPRRSPRRGHGRPRREGRRTRGERRRRRSRSSPRRVPRARRRRTRRRPRGGRWRSRRRVRPVRRAVAESPRPHPVRTGHARGQRPAARRRPPRRSRRTSPTSDRCTRAEVTCTLSGCRRPGRPRSSCLEAARSPRRPTTTRCACGPRGRPGPGVGCDGRAVLATCGRPSS